MAFTEKDVDFPSKLHKEFIELKHNEKKGEYDYHKLNRDINNGNPEPFINSNSGLYPICIKKVFSNRMCKNNIRNGIWVNEQIELIVDVSSRNEGKEYTKKECAEIVKFANKMFPSININSSKSYDIEIVKAVKTVILTVLAKTDPNNVK